MTTQEIQTVVAQVKRLLKMGAGLAAFTPTQLDDQVIAKLQEFVAMVEPYTEEPWLPELFDFVMGILKKDDPKIVLMKLKEII
jgi:hypothetical protein